MYKPAELPGLTAGSITAIYLQASVDRPNAVAFRNMTVKMCHQPVDESGPNPDTIPHSVFPRVFFPCSTVFYSPLFVPATPIDSGDWIRFTLQTPFQYDGSGNLLVEFSQDSGTTGFQALPYLFTTSYKHILRTYEASNNPIFSSNWLQPGIPAQMNLIGIDMTPALIGSIRGLDNVQFYPNPAYKVIVKLGDYKQENELSVTFTDVTGAVVLRHKYVHGGTHFSATVDVSKLPRGVYFAILTSDGQRVTKKVVLQ